MKKVLKKQNNATRCFVCGVNNESGLKTEFYELDDNTIVGIAQPLEIHQSYPGRVHGGVITALLDETIGRAINITEVDTWGVTVEINTKYKKPVPYGEELKIVGKITDNNRRMFKGEGQILLKNGEIAAIGEATYMKFPLSKIADFEANGESWKQYIKSTDPKEFDL